MGKPHKTKPPQPTTLLIPEEINGLAEFKLIFNENPQRQLVFPIFVDDI